MLSAGPQAKPRWARQHLARGVQIQTPDLGQHDAPGAALEQQRAELTLQMADRLGQARGALPSSSAARLKPPCSAAATKSPTTEDLRVLPLYRALAEKGELNVHVAALLPAHPQSKPDDLEMQAEVMRRFADVPNLSFLGIKVFVDGILEYPGQTAPYANR